MEKNYKCELCGKSFMVKEGDAIPECCGQKMVPEIVKPCTHVQNPEMARNDYDDDPCDDGRGGNI